MLLERSSRERATPGDLLEKGTVLIVEHGEPGVALEILCDQLADDDIAVTRDTLVELDALGSMMGVVLRVRPRVAT